MQSDNEFVNESGLEFTDISSEEYREYLFPGGDEIRINRPLRLNVSKNGHRAWDAFGNSHYIPQGWIHLHWRVPSGAPHFVK